ncbi:MAG: tRNA 4-thiouridine(8) synthase ThiI [Patescibacteria group bacterium]|nr:tRNA 4-thiouridine(8) synthase ThiI [Patescibacteria group bacterium]
MKKPIALVLMSGGLDSLLAARILMDFNIRVEGIGFKTPFFSADRGRRSAEELGIQFHEIDFSKQHFEKVKKPNYGYGKAINPCIDCHALMIKTAWEFLISKGEENNGFIATGEVLGQRPMSQNNRALKIVETAANLPGKFLLRPLSAKLLDPTEPELKGWVNREKLFAISGRNRGAQIELANKFKLHDYMPPAGGCILTEKKFGEILRELLSRWPSADAQTAGLLRYGRVYFFDDCLALIGRSEQENDILKKLKRDRDLLIELNDVSGSAGLIRPFSIFKTAKINEEVILFVKQKIQRYSREASKVNFNDLVYVIT